ncbi:MAG: BlaI/MecI/CopY family transcriptional regulator [Lachnospiraceae bacterium]|nr:BlaI/MecI/CopY family transcriptional regulator [Lachnospiraceae bacterium]
MENQHINLTDAEWNVMECLWEKSPRTGRETIEYLKERMGWSRSTTLTLLRRMEEKGAVGSELSGEVKQFIPLISREQAAIQETEDFLGRVYKGSLGMMLSSFTKKQTLSKNEINELYSILKELEANADD